MIDHSKILVFMILLLVTGIAQQRWKSPELIKRESDAKFRVAQQYERQGQTARALEIYRDLFRRDPRNAAYYTRYSRLLFNQKNLSELDDVIQHYRTENPNDERALVDQGRLYFMKGDTSLADEFWMANWRDNHFSKTFIRTLFNTLISMAQFDRAENVIQQARDHYNQPGLFAIELANFQMLRGNYLNSAGEYLRFGRENRRNYNYISNQILRFPTDSILYQQLDSLIRLELQKYPETAELYQLRADLFFKSANYDKAIDQMMRVEFLNNNKGNNILKLANDLVNIGQFKRAQQVYTTIIRDETFRQLVPQALLGLANAFEKEIVAEQLYSPFDYFYRDNFFFVSEYIYGIEADNDNIRRAFSIYDSLIVGLPKADYTAEALLRLAELRYRVLQDIDGAARLYRDALENSGNNDIKNVCRVRLLDMTIARGDLTTARQIINKSNITNADLSSEYTARKLLISYFMNETDSIPVFANDLLGMLDIKDPRFNDVIEFQNFIEQFLNKNTEAGRDFVKSELLIRQSKLSEARELLNYLVVNYPDTEIAVPAQFRLLQIELFFHNRHEAENVLEAILTQGSQFDADALLMMGELAQFRDGDVDYATRWYHRLLEQYPGSFMKDEVRKRLRRIQAESRLGPES